MYQYFKDRASRIQSENLLSGFAEAQPIFERSSKIVLSFRQCKVRDKKKATEVIFRRRRVSGSFA